MPAKKIMTKKQHKRMQSRSKTHKKKMMAMPAKLWGGASYDSDSLAAKYASCGSADRHNLQTGEANLALINGAGVVPPTQTGGATATMTNGTCPGNSKLLSFKDYTTNVAALLGVPASVPQPSMQMGGGYSIDPAAEQIGGQPARVGYSDCCPPVSLEGSLLMGANSGAVCGQQAGGAGSCGAANKQKGGRKQRKGTKCTQRKSKKQRGGDSVPAAFPSESHTGADGDFSDHGEQLHYDAKQPFWNATAR